ncbi:PREDICTED: LOC110762039 isoform [Prunus dulcis]|uniref:PREDICTED: LOC110762039 isoform n=1 Tax=Prunus dulcis TaxID=3755 RepID=A0A5E4FYR8_PRUDU|nr:PREDICTED: LOC110762039 isoform [Prunus dulcis]
MWASTLISRDLPYGLMVNKGNNYHYGGELYYPIVAGYQLGFIQSIPIPPMDSVNLLSSWQVEFKDAKEVTTLTNFNQDLVKSFNIPIRDPRFGDSNIFIHRHCPFSLVFQQEKEKKKVQAKADTTEKENPPTDIFLRESSAKSADANSGRGEKNPNSPIQGSLRPAEHPSSSHLIVAVQPPFTPTCKQSPFDLWVLKPTPKWSSSVEIPSHPS